MYFDLQQTVLYANSFKQKATAHLKLNAKEWTDTTVFMIPTAPTLSLPPVLDMVANSTQMLLGAQDCHWEDRGAYTGEVSPLMLHQIGCRIVELGHAERRRSPVNETDDIVARKAQAVAKNHMTPLVCIGELEQDSDASQAVSTAVDFCKYQIMAPLQALQTCPGPDAKGRLPSVIFAYEPTWAIGASKPASADHVLNVILALRQIAAEQFSGDVRFLYGGSAGPGTWATLKKGCDGLFLGRFAHDVDNFIRVIEEVATS